MTHAALKDLVKKWRDDAGAGYGYRFALTNCADELSAALSAMEGEAVAWLVSAGDSSEQYRCAHTLRGDADADAARLAERKWPNVTVQPIYTAPPPQQAEDTECRHDAWEVTASGAYHETRDCADCGQHLGRFARQDDNPTPSPGPQGGGEVDPALVEFSRWFAKNYPGPDTIISDPNWHAPRIFRSAEYMLRTLRATPPAHQPGEVVTPPKFTTGHCEHHKKPGGCPFHNLQCGWPDCDRKPAAIAPKEAGHG